MDRLTGFAGTLLNNIILRYDVSAVVTRVSRLALPVLAAAVLIRCALSLLSEKLQREVWGYITMPNGGRWELTNWENLIGRARSSDVVLDYPSVSRTHAALTRDVRGQWTVHDLRSTGGVKVRGHEIKEPTPVHGGDIITFGGVTTVFMPSTTRDEQIQAEERRRPGERIKPGATLVLLTLFVLILGAQHTAAGGADVSPAVPAAFLAHCVIMWACYAITRALDRTGFEVETLAFMLTAVGLGICASSAPGSLFKLVFCTIAGLCLYFFIGIWLRDLDRTKKLRLPMAVGGFLLLCVNLLTARSIFGAKNWLQIGGISFQPSEFVKICFIFAGASTLDRLFARRNLIVFVGFAAACVGCLAMMSDFGTAAVFFTAYIVIAFMRSGSFATVFLSLAGTGFGVFIVLTARPYVLDRFAAWGHAWEMASDGGYQQTRTMAAAASGGLFGLGGGKGWLHNVFAADTDMVFGMAAEEYGLILAATLVLSILVLAVFAVRSAGYARSSFYAIGACAAVTIMLTQLILNVFGSLDILPFTGVTFPFVSKGGSSLMATWGLLAFVKAADARQNASFAIRLERKKLPQRRRRGRGEAEE